jgi:hypothetical protein
MFNFIEITYYFRISRALQVSEIASAIYNGHATCLYVVFMFVVCIHVISEDILAELTLLHSYKVN